jgi:hypothetical protein
MNLTGSLADFPVMRVDVCPFAIAAGPDAYLPPGQGARQYSLVSRS